MQNEIQVRMLRLILTNGSVLNLVEMGYTYSQIILLLDELEANEYIASSNEGTLLITEKGKSFLNDYAKIKKLNGGDQWIWPQTKYLINKIAEWDVFFPRKL